MLTPAHRPLGQSTRGLLAPTHNNTARLPETGLQRQQHQLNASTWNQAPGPLMHTCRGRCQVPECHSSYDRGTRPHTARGAGTASTQTEAGSGRLTNSVGFQPLPSPMHAVYCQAAMQRLATLDHHPSEHGCSQIHTQWPGGIHERCKKSCAPMLCYASRPKPYYIRVYTNNSALSLSQPDDNSNMKQRVWAKEQRSCCQLQRTHSAAEACSSSHGGGELSRSKSTQPTLDWDTAQHSTWQRTTHDMHRHAGHRQVPTTRKVSGSSCRPAATACCSCRHHHSGAISSYSYSCCWEAIHASWHVAPEAPECVHGHEPLAGRTGTASTHSPPHTHQTVRPRAPRLRRPVLDESS